MKNPNDYIVGQHPDLPPPSYTGGVLGWIKTNLFGSPKDIIFSLFGFYILWLLVPPIFQWMIWDSVFIANSRAECRVGGDGACWAVIVKRIGQFAYGLYPDSERYRLNICFFAFFLAIAPLLYDRLPFRKFLLWFTAFFPILAYWLVVGGFAGLPLVETHKFGGFMLTMVIGVTGITFSLPIGIVLALGRQSHMPTIRLICVCFIEFFRGVPLITLLFVASVMLNYFLPPGSEFDLLLRVLIMVSLFASAYMAEVIRGGLQALPKGQYEAGQAMGLSYWQSMRFIILPQALKVSIPGIVNTFIGLYKDTTLVYIIGLLDPLGIGISAISDGNWLNLSTEVYIFVAIFFFICCFGMSRYSLYLEKKLETGHKR